MITKTYMTIVENVGSQKEAVAARRDFDVARIVADARRRQESSDRREIRQGEQVGAGQPATRLESDSEGIQTPQPESEGRSR